MPIYSTSSKAKLSTCHAKLQLVMNKAIEYFDIKILCGVRSDEEQIKAFNEGRSKLDGITKKSKHQADPRTGKSHAVDAGPYPIDWDLRKPHIFKRWYFFGGFIVGLAFAMGIKLKWGGDWDNDTWFNDQSFNDLPHFELDE